MSVNFQRLKKLYIPEDGTLRFVLFDTHTEEYSKVLGGVMMCRYWGI
jgi:hypothetical protein